MNDLSKDDQKLVDALFQRMLANHAPLNVGGFAKNAGLGISNEKIKYLEDLLWETNLTDKVLGYGDVRFLLRLNSKGNVLLNRHGSYSKYVAWLKKQNREPWPKRNWLWVAVIAYVAGIASNLIVEYSKRKIWPESNLSTPTIPAKSDTLKNGH